MRRMRSSGVVLAGLLIGLLLSSTQGHAQFPSPRIPDASGQDRRDPGDQARRQMEEKMELRRNDLRQEQLVKDTNKLLALATELKAQVDKSNKDTLSIDVVKKAEEIEKLAKNVKDRMKY